jgi:hypothetical protein
VPHLDCQFFISVCGYLSPTSVGSGQSTMHSGRYQLLRT